MDRDALATAILELEVDTAPPLEDPELAHALGLHIKPHIDRLYELGKGGDAVQNKQPRRRRKDPPLELDLDGTPPQLVDLLPREQARWIFMDRFITLEQTEEILGYEIPVDDFEAYNKAFVTFMGRLLDLPRVAAALQTNDVPQLQKMFSSCLLLFRSPVMGGPGGSLIPCTIESLRDKFPSYFYKRRKVWYERLDFFSSPVERPVWALCDTDMLNCTLFSPERRLSSYAQKWHLPQEDLHQKTVLEDIYDRILSGEALKEDLFPANYNSCTATTYARPKSDDQRQVFTAQRDHQISIHGKSGLPHWRARRRLWAGVSPTVVLV